MMQITGFEHFSAAVMQSWNSKMCLRIAVPFRAGSRGELVFWDTKFAEWMSRPAVKARGPAPVRRMARIEGSEESVSKMRRNSCHMLRWWWLVGSGPGGRYVGGGGLGCGRETAYASWKAFSLSARLISTWAMYSAGFVTLKYL